MSRLFMRFAALLALQSCGFAHDERIAGPYRLVSIDVPEDTRICYTLDNDGDCIGRIPSTVFAAGSNDTYVVAARHPDNDRLRTEYFYIIRSLDRAEADPTVAVRGPFDAVTWQGEQAHLALPRLTRVIDSLK